MRGDRVRVTRLLRPCWPLLGVAFAAMVVEGATDLLNPWPLKIVFDSVIGRKSPPGWLTAWPALTADRIALLNAAGLAIVAIATLGAAASYARSYLTTTVAQHVAHDLRHTLYHHVQRLSLAFYEQRQTGDMVVRLTSDIDAAQNFISSVLIDMILDVLTLTGMLGVMVYLDWHFTLIAISVVPVLFVVVYRLTRRIKRAAREVKKQESELASVVLESLSLVRVIKAFAREDYEEDRFDHQSMQSVDAVLRARSIKARLSPLVDIIVSVGTCLVLVVGVRLVVAEQITSGALLVFVLYMARMFKPIKDLSKMTDTMSKSLVSLDRIREVLDTESLVRDLPGARRAPLFRGRIEFDGVRFGYLADRPVLENITLTIEPGQSIALVGRTGCGKSTLIGLIPRFYDVWDGAVRIDGLDVRGLTLKSLRDSVSLVLQDAVLFRAPIWQNIAYGRQDATHDEIVNAARAANADEFISQLPNGYSTVVGERGDTLSGGQRQRIAIARAIVRNTPILLLDEPSASLDTESEYLILQALNRLMPGKTCITIAHRLTTVRRADRIFVLDNGSIIEAGKHEELLTRGGMYARLHEAQFKAVGLNANRRVS
jgi:subfamily B ATP-binding cassette protein MsbA